jgi:hypothetical protein
MDNKMNKIEDKFKEYKYKTNPQRGVKVPLDCAIKGEELVGNSIKAQTPLELAEVFSKYSFLNNGVGDKLFNKALDLSERTLYTSKNLATQDNLYFLNFIDYTLNENAITQNEADKAIELIIKTI